MAAPLYWALALDARIVFSMLQPAYGDAVFLLLPVAAFTGLASLVFLFVARRRFAEAETLEKILFCLWALDGAIVVAGAAGCLPELGGRWRWIFEAASPLGSEGSSGQPWHLLGSASLLIGGVIGFYVLIIGEVLASPEQGDARSSGGAVAAYATMGVFAAAASVAAGAFIGRPGPSFQRHALRAPSDSTRVEPRSAYAPAQFGRGEDPPVCTIVTGGATDPKPRSPLPLSLVYDIKACIDDHDQLVVAGGQLQWHHFTGSAPGEHPTCPLRTTQIQVSRVDADNATHVSHYSWTPVFTSATATPRGPRRDVVSVPFRLHMADAIPVDGGFEVSSLQTAGRSTSVRLTAAPTCPGGAANIDFTDRPFRNLGAKSDVKKVVIFQKVAPP